MYFWNKLYLLKITTDVAVHWKVVCASSPQTARNHAAKAAPERFKKAWLTATCRVLEPGSRVRTVVQGVSIQVGAD